MGSTGGFGAGLSTGGAARLSKPPDGGGSAGGGEGAGAGPGGGAGRLGGGVATGGRETGGA
ncbi:MAG: hypothetical protein IT368_10400 [Candidatus Hydrogenedentes bacterium]|nr:hypothetical protein [Candidatus Hydrogenedentota bacterium]